MIFAKNQPILIVIKIRVLNHHYFHKLANPDTTYVECSL